VKVLKFSNDSWSSFCEYCLVKGLIDGLDVVRKDSTVLLVVRATGTPGLDEAIKDFGAQEINFQ
jgi:hypothetical protein